MSLKLGLISSIPSSLTTYHIVAFNISQSNTLWAPYHNCDLGITKWYSFLNCDTRCCRRGALCFIFLVCRRRCGGIEVCRYVRVHLSNFRRGCDVTTLLTSLQAPLFGAWDEFMVRSFSNSWLRAKGIQKHDIWTIFKPFMVAIQAFIRQYVTLITLRNQKLRSMQ